MSEWHGLPSEPEGGSPSPRPIRCQQPLPMLPSWHVCNSLLLLRDFAELGREAPSLNCGCLLGQESLGPPSSEPRSPQARPAQGWPHSVPFLFRGGCRKPERLAALSPTSFHRPVFPSPWATATSSGLGVPALGPSSDSEAGAGSSCCRKERVLS